MKEALKLALEALEWINRVNAMDYEYQQKAREALNEIYEALAQPKQEPVAIELALAGLVEKITGGFDSGDLLADAVTASKMLDAQPKQPISVQPEQEPVAFIESKADNECADAYADGWNACVHAHKDTTPPQRPWVGLTENEIEYWIGCNTSKPALVRAISKALKEKNT